MQDRLDIWEYIATENPRAAVHMDELFSAAVASLADFPDKGRLGWLLVLAS
ncbi:type II toxin-antitoxin system RelE/ParE family toxin [Pseudomonas sp. BMW13]|uniref:type II toxin-antitoxin system RelE/ParE family toxin n=1 Tax=Pseudomonas sp. BMW13 TaxID=2562590 RepID=UPI0035A2DEE2